jgi:hypothetical protein
MAAAPRELVSGFKHGLGVEVVAGR